MNNIARRDVLVAFAAMLAGVMLPSPGPVAGEVPGSQAVGLLNVLVPDIAAGGRLGRAYLTAHPDELDLQRLVNGVLGPMRLSGGADAIDSIPEAVLIARVRRVVIDDYLAGRIVNIDGWVLSITEARLYALAALADDKVR
ncbi:MAG: hypothetical protein WBN07_01830 [Woeseiaceae bacterium]